MSESDCATLMGSVRDSDTKLDSHRDLRAKMMRHAAGPYYPSNNQMESRQPLNLLYSLVGTYEPSLAMKEVRVEISTSVSDNRWFAENFSEVMNRGLGRANVADALRRAIRDALFGVGLLKVGYDDSKRFPFYCDSISLDDFIIDRRCRRFTPDDYAYVGHRFRLNKNEAMESDIFDGNAKDVLKQLHEEDMRRGHERAGNIGIGGGGIKSGQFEPKIELVELWLPRTNRIVWLPGYLDSDIKKYLREFEYDGPKDTGPMSMLGFSYLNDNVLPVSPLSIIYDLYLLENALACKIADQAKNQKDIGIISSPVRREADALRDSQNGDILTSEDAKGTVLSFGGANEKGYQAVAWFQDWLSRVSGNSDLLGGANAGSATLGQDQMLMGNASIRVNDHRSQVHKVAGEIAEKFAYFIWNDPEYQTTELVTLNGGIEIPIEWLPSERIGSLDDYDLSIDVYARNSDTPAEKGERMGAWMQQFILPVLDYARQTTGSTLDFDLLANVAGRHFDVPEIKGLWKEGEPIEPTASNSKTVNQPGGGVAFTNAQNGSGQQQGGSAINDLAQPAKE